MDVIRAETSQGCDITRGPRLSNERPRGEGVVMRATRAVA